MNGWMEVNQQLLIEKEPELAGELQLFGEERGIDFQTPLPTITSSAVTGASSGGGVTSGPRSNGGNATMIGGGSGRGQSELEMINGE